MANLNLSQFGENTSVSDADYTFVWDSAASISKKVSRNSWLNSGTLTSDAPVTISQTWNNAAVAFTGLKVNATSTNSASGSLLLDLQVGGVSTVSVRKDGKMSLWELQAAFVVNTQYLNSTNNVALTTNNAGLYFGASNDVILRWDAANTLALRNGGNAQTFNVYGTWTTAITNFERLAIKYNTTDLAYQIAAEKGTTNGDYRPLQLWTGGASRLHVSTAGNVGIGTTAPRYKFSNTNIVLGDWASVEPSITSGFGWMASEANKYASNFANNTVGGYGMSIYANSNGTQKLLTLSNNSADVVNFLANGNVGIGTTSPTSKLQVTGGDVEIETVTSGIIMKAAGTSTRYRITLNAGGTALVFTAI